MKIKVNTTYFSDERLLELARLAAKDIPTKGVVLEFRPAIEKPKDYEGIYLAPGFIFKWLRCLIPPKIKIWCDTEYRIYQILCHEFKHHSQWTVEKGTIWKSDEQIEREALDYENKMWKNYPLKDT